MEETHIRTDLGLIPLALHFILSVHPVRRQFRLHIRGATTRASDYWMQSADHSSKSEYLVRR